MKNYTTFNRTASFTALAFCAALLAYSFQKAPVQYTIVDGTFVYWPEQSETYYMWDNSTQKTYQVHSRYDVLRIMQAQGYELVTTYAHQTSNSGGFSRFQSTWIFKK